MKKVLIICGVIILILFVLLCPVKCYYKDGGTVAYKAILYTVYDKHSWVPDGILEGTVVEILGFEVYNDTKITVPRDYEN